MFVPVSLDTGSVQLTNIKTDIYLPLPVTLVYHIYVHVCIYRYVPRFKHTLRADGLVLRAAGFFLIRLSPYSGLNPYEA